MYQIEIDQRFRQLRINITFTIYCAILSSFLMKCEKSQAKLIMVIYVRRVFVLLSHIIHVVIV